MLFTTLTFFIFFIFVYASYWSLKGKSREYLLIVSSIIFYGAWSVAFAVHFLFIVLLNYLFIKLILQKKNKKLLIAVLLIDAGNLFFFKYFYLFLETIYITSGGSDFFRKDIFNGWLFGTFYLKEIALPLAISFYTFQLIAFVVDAYRGKIEENVGWSRFVLFIMFFPQLVAGPIMRHSDFFWQLDRIAPNRDKTIAGMFLLVSGFVKKTVVADNMRPLYGDIYQNPEKYDWQSNLIAPVAFAIHVYSDFSGYTDIARGLAGLLALDLPENFKGPYLSRSQQELWRRWHVTLSSWLRHYIFIPLGGSRGSELRTNINLIITFTLGGLWHGANYTFMVWGAFHGILISLERTLQNFPLFVKINALRSGKAGFIISAIQIALTFTFFLVGCVFFNSPDLVRASGIFTQIVSFSDGIHSKNIGQIAALLIPVFIMNYIQTREKIPELSVNAKYALAAASVFLLIFLMGRFAPTGNEFIYFQF